MKKKQNWTRQENNEAFTSFRTMILIIRNHKQCQKQTVNKEGFSDALQSHRTNRPERFKLEGDPVQVNGLSKGRKDSESQRIRIKKEYKHSNKEHIVDRGHVSMSHNKVGA